MIIEPIHVKFSQREHILVVNDIDQHLPEDRWQHICTILWHVELQHIDGAAK